MTVSVEVSRGVNDTRILLRIEPFLPREIYPRCIGTARVAAPSAGSFTERVRSLWKVGAPSITGPRDHVAGTISSQPCRCSDRLERNWFIVKTGAASTTHGVGGAASGQEGCILLRPTLGTPAPRGAPPLKLQPIDGTAATSFSRS